MKGGLEVESEEETHFKEMLKRSLFIMDKWLSWSNYLTGDEISIADISAICELKTYDFFGGDYEKYPNLKWWKEKMFEIKEVVDVHKAHEKIVEMSRGIFEAKL